MVGSLGVPVTIEKTEDHVPSFMEKWVWFQVTREEGDITEQVNGEAERTALDGSTEKKEEKKEGKTDEKKEEKKEEKGPKAAEDTKESKKQQRASPDKKEEKKGGAKDLKDQLEVGKEKGLSKEKSNLDKKSKKAK